MNEDDLWKLMADDLTGEGSGASRKKLEKLTADDASLQFCRHVLQAFWKMPSINNKAEAEMALSKVISRLGIKENIK